MGSPGRRHVARASAPGPAPVPARGLVQRPGASGQGQGPRGGELPDQAGAGDRQAGARLGAGGAGTRSIATHLACGRWWSVTVVGTSLRSCDHAGRDRAPAGGDPIGAPMVVPPGPAGLTVPEMRRLGMVALSLPVRPPQLRLEWSWWRRAKRQHTRCRPHRRRALQGRHDCHESQLRSDTGSPAGAPAELLAARSRPAVQRLASSRSGAARWLPPARRSALPSCSQCSPPPR